jgi:hypothetical protein
VLLFLARAVMSDGEELFAGTYNFHPNTTAAFVTDQFSLREPGTVEIAVSAPRLQNEWIDFDLALINIDTGTAWNVSREVSFYSGRDSDGAWSEGDRDERVLLPQVPAGAYYLRVEPVSPFNNVEYTLRVRRDVMSLLPYGLALAALALPAVLAFAHSGGFERRRLQESDYSG